MCVKCRLDDVARALKCVYVCVCGRGVKCQRAARGGGGGGGEAPGAESSQWLEEDTQLQLLEIVCNTGE